MQSESSVVMSSPPPSPSHLQQQQEKEELCRLRQELIARGGKPGPPPEYKYYIEPPAAEGLVYPDIDLPLPTEKFDYSQVRGLRSLRTKWEANRRMYLLRFTRELFYKLEDAKDSIELYEGIHAWHDTIASLRPMPEILKHCLTSRVPDLAAGSEEYEAYMSPSSLAAARNATKPYPAGYGVRAAVQIARPQAHAAAAAAAAPTPAAGLAAGLAEQQEPVDQPEESMEEREHRLRTSRQKRAEIVRLCDDYRIFSIRKLMHACRCHEDGYLAYFNRAHARAVRTAIINWVAWDNTYMPEYPEDI